MPRTQPSDQDAERQVLGAILTSAAALDTVATTGLRSEDFYIPKHQRIFQAAIDLYTSKEAVDITTVGAKVPDLKNTVNELAEGVRSVRNVKSHAKAVKDFATRREILSVASQMADLAYDKELDEVQSFAKSVVTQVLTNDDERRSLLSPADQVNLLRSLIAERREGIEYGVSSGFKRLDNLTGGLRRGDLIVVGARTSVGKSSFAECIAENVAKAGHPVLFVSVEMDPAQMAVRMARRYGIEEEILNGKQVDEFADDDINQLAQERMDMPLYIWNAPGASTVGIRAHLNQLQAQIGAVELVVVDYLQLLDDNFGSKLAEHLRLGKITKTLKQIAREYQVPVLLITQLNRASDQRGVLPEPRLSDIRESGRIEEDADLILFLWRERELDAFNNDTHLKIAKNRMGPLGKVPIIFNKQYFTFFEPTDGQLMKIKQEEQGEDEKNLAALGILLETAEKLYGNKPVDTGNTGPETNEETEDREEGTFAWGEETTEVGD